MISGKARVAGIAGWPVTYSRSPRLHNFWLQSYGIDGAYLPLPIRPDAFEAAMRALPKLGFAGCNVTLPHKETALTCVDRVDAVARRIGAVNTIVVAEDGSLDGSNTDAYGFIQALTEDAPQFDASRGPAVLIGAGGAAKAIAVALLDAGVPELVLVNRTRARAEALADALGSRATVGTWAERAERLAGARLLVNSTSLGMQGQPPLELPLDDLANDAVVMDAVYLPLKTPLLAAAEQRGNAIVDGLGMLLHQARPGFAAWFGRDPIVGPALRAHVLADL